MIEATLSQVKGVGNLSITGGEPTLAIDRIEKIIDYIIENNIYIEEFTTTINGTIYSERLLELLKIMDKYINDEEVLSMVAISCDIFHLDEIKRLGLFDKYKENVSKYNESKYFFGIMLGVAAAVAPLVYFFF